MNVFRYYLIKLIIAAIAIITISSCNEKKKFEGYLYPIKENGLYGYIDSVGNRIIEPQFLWVSPFTNGLAVAVVDTIYREVPDSMAYEVGERDSVIDLYRMYAKYGYIDKTGRFAIKPTFVTYVTMPEKGYRVNDMTDCRNAFSRYTFHSKRALFCDPTTWKNGYINNKGEIVINPRYYYSDPFSEGLAVVRDAVAEPLYTNKACITPSKLRCAYLDTLGNAVTEFKYESLTRFGSGRGIGSYKIIKRENVDIADTTIVWETYSTPRFLINADGKEIKELNFNYDYYGFSRDGISLAYDGFIIRSFLGKENISYYFINTEGNLLEPLNGLSEYQLDSLEKCGDIMQVLPDNAKISAATYFGDGFAGISPDKKHWFVIDKHLIIHGYGDESIYEGFGGYSNGVAAVKKKGKWGYINKKIKEQIPCKYDSCGLAYPFLEEIFEYDIQGDISKIGYINRNDSLIWENKIPKVEEIKNKYSGKEKKNWGKWTYNGNTFQDNINIWNVMAFCFILFVILALWRTFSSETLKKQVEIEQNQIVSIDDNASRPLEDSSMIDDDLHIYPSVGQYTKTIKLSATSPDEYFAKLSNFHPVFDEHGDPIMSNGNFAVVYKMVDENGKYHAVRCFHRYQEGRRQSYKLICEELAKVSSPYLLPIQYMENELYVDSVEYPVLLMDWVDGITLDKYIRMIINDNAKLHSLADNFRQMAIWLLNQPFAHGDLKPDNILVKGDGSLVLVDYDGMYVPAMKGQSARELGSPDFTEPSRDRSIFDKNIDNFSIISILLSLEMIVGKKEYLERYGAEDRLLFSRDDYLNLRNCSVFKRALISYGYISELASMLESMVAGKICNIDNLKTLLMNGNQIDRFKSNSKIEMKAYVFMGLYSIMMLILPLYLRSVYSWHIIMLYITLLLLDVLLFFILSFIDIMRPNKRNHIDPTDSEGATGCLAWFCFIPLLFMVDSITDWFNETFPFMNQPYYKGEWYTTALIWICWWYSNAAFIALPQYLLEWRLKYFKTKEEIKEEDLEKELSAIRKEIKKEDERWEKSKKTNKYDPCDELPF